MVFRNIQPGPPPDGAAANSGDSRQVIKRRINEACVPCRRFKVKCDGQQPQCSACTKRTNQECIYPGTPSVAKKRAVEFRLGALEILVKKLQIESQDEAIRTLDAIRNGADIESVINPAGSGSKLSESGTKGTIFKTLISNNSLLRSIIALQAELSPRSDQDAANDKQTSCPLLSWQKADDANMERGITGFFSCSGKLFHVFTEQQVDKHRAVLSSDSSSNTQKASALCCISAVVAIGIQYTHHSTEFLTEQVFYGIAKHYYDYLIEHNTLDALKVCSLFAMFNVFSKATVALSYVDVGLGLCQRMNLRNPPEQMKLQWADYRKTRRTFLFLSGWLSSTLGYVSGSNMQTEQMLFELGVQDQSDLSDLVQSEMAKIALLKSNIVRTQASFGALAAASFKTMMHDLELWYRALPKALHLSSVTHDDIALEVRRSMYHVHLLYLGAIILLYRQMVSQLVEMQDTSPYLHEDKETLLRGFEDSQQAARHSSMILKLMLDQESIFRRCWLVICQSFTTAIILLYWIVQRKLHKASSTFIEKDLERAWHCLQVLEYCSTSDPVAHKLYGILTTYFGTIVSVDTDCPELRTTPMKSQATVLPDTLFELAEPDSNKNSSREINTEPFIIPLDGNPTLKTCAFELLSLIRQPFGDFNDVSAIIDEDINAHSWTDPSRYEPAQFVDRLIWQHNKSKPFYWDLEKIGIKGLTSTSEGPAGLGDRTRPSPSQFLGSAQPSGWSNRLPLAEGGNAEE